MYSIFPYPPLSVAIGFKQGREHAPSARRHRLCVRKESPSSVPGRGIHISAPLPEPLRGSEAP
eukprot:4317577-Heterocapsa_arctica.AAC.1